MRVWVSAFWVLIGATLWAGSANSALTPTDWADARHWVVEQMPGGTVAIAHGKIVIEDADGCTLWWRSELTIPVRISYDATMISAGGPHDRVSDLNCFWMAQEPGSQAAPFEARPRHGKFTDYDSLLTYYVGYGGNTNSTTRFRRYDGGSKPLLPQYDLRDRAHLLEPNHRYHIELIAANGRAEFYRDGEKVFSYEDPHPLTHGWFGFRTVRSHIVIENFRIDSGAK